MAQTKQPPVVHPKSPQTGKGQVEKQPNTLPNSKHVPVTGQS
jgi:hypothetical protein